VITSVILVSTSTVVYTSVTTVLLVDTRKPPSPAFVSVALSTVVVLSPIVRHDGGHKC
jgi:hypothetical protein